MNKLDPMGIGQGLTLFPEQVKKGWSDAMASNIVPMEFDSVLISGMGGSSNAGKILQSLLENDFKKQLVIRNDYGLPGWVNENTLVVANSYSGNTEETLSAITEAQKRGSKVVGITTGGKLAEMIKSGEVVGAIITAGNTNPSGFPKSGLGVSLGALAGSLVKVGVLNITEVELDSALAELIKIRDSWKAKEMAEWLHGNMPVLFGARPLMGALNSGRNAMCEISRNYTQFYDFPEVNHVLIEALQKPSPIVQNRYVFFESTLYHPRIKTRIYATKKIMEEMDLKYSYYQLLSASPLGQSLELPHFCAWVGFYISMLDGVDPDPEPWIVKLKKSINQPVH